MSPSLPQRNRVLFLRPRGNQAVVGNVVQDFIYGCWCNGKRIGGMQMPPINELYAATTVRSAGLEVEFIDAPLEPERYRLFLENRLGETLAVAIMSSTQSFRKDVETLIAIKNLDATVRSILYGSHPTFMPHYCLREQAVDFIVTQEPEEGLRELTLAIAHNESVENILGIGLRNANGEPCINPPRPFANMDNLPIPDRLLLPTGIDYFNPTVKRTPYTTMTTSRGCPARCIFCTAPFFYGNKARFRSGENVLKELREIKKMGYREVFFRDETFTAYKRRNLEICEGMIREKLNLSWIANARVDMVDRETLMLMKQAGCHMVKFGVETGDEQIMANYKKGTTCEQTRETFRMAHEVGLDTHAHVMLGGPGETPETIEKTIRFAIDLDPTTASFGILTPYAGTPLFQELAKDHPEILDGSASNMENLHTTGFFSQEICQLSSEYLSQCVVRAYRRFYWRPGYLWKRLKGIDHFEELIILIVAGFNIFQFSLTGDK